MALSGTNRGTGGNNTASTTINISPASNFTVGSMAILSIAYDNAGSAGADNFSSITDSNNTWNLAISQLNDPGAANAGSVLRVYYATVALLTTSNTITITFAANVTAKAWTLTEALSNIGIVEYQSIGVTGVSGNGTTQTVTLGGPDAFIYGVLGQEGNGTRTGDTDTTFGTWSTAQSTGFGTTTGGQEIISQYKIQVGGSTNQTYNPVATPLGDWNMALIRFGEVIQSSYDPFGMMGFFGI